MKKKRITTSQLIDNIKTALAGDEELKKWCQDNYLKEPSIYIGVNPDEPPEENEYPVIALVSVYQTRGESLSNIFYEMYFKVAILQNEILTEGNTKIYTGLKLIEDLREHVENALFRADIATVETNSESETDTFYPVFLSDFSIKLQLLKSTRLGLP